MNSFTKMQLIRIIEEQQKEIDTLKDRINDCQNTIKELKNKYESTDFEKFIELNTKIVERTTTENIQNEYLKATGKLLNKNEINNRMLDLGFNVKYNGKCGVSSYITKRTRGCHYLIQLENEKSQSIFKVGIAADMLNRINNYFHHEQTNVIIYKVFEVNNMNKSENELKDILNKQNIPIAHGSEFFITNYETILKYYLDVVNKYDGKEIDVNRIIARQKKGNKDGFKIIVP